jgi:hypothetical protein
MATGTYMAGRQKYARPQGVLFSKNSGRIVENGKYAPDGFEFGSLNVLDADAEFIILSDDNRAPIEFKTTRIENRKRMINGRMRSYHVADKLNINLSWTMLPSRSYFGNPNFSTTTGDSDKTESCTSDGGAGGVEILRWYEDNQGPFWLFLSYDKYSNFDGTTDRYSHLAEYSQVVEVYISNFEYSVQKRGGRTDDFWNISISLEEV